MRAARVECNSDAHDKNVGDTYNCTALSYVGKSSIYGGDKTKFEEFWGLFESLVDQSKEPVNLKMGRLRQCLFGSALESIRGLEVSEPEYEEAKEILIPKFGGRRRQLRAYMDQLEKMPQLRNNDIQGFEKFADLVRITVVKLKAEGCNGELLLCYTNRARSDLS